MDRRRLWPLLAGLTGTLAWLALLYFAGHLFWVSPLLPWSLIAGTVMGVVFLRKRLFVATGWCPPPRDENPVFTTNVGPDSETI
jgi:hypothetical protein